MQAELRVMLNQDPRPSPLLYETSHTAERGTIVNVASVAGLFGLSGLVSYTTSKHSCVGLAKTGAVEHPRDLIRVNAVCPSFIDTPMARK
jgi:NAD(P)-dependent dehydrogenase (short-subunit alcohol dehydrogenase family)